MHIKILTQREGRIVEHTDVAATVMPQVALVNAPSSLEGKCAAELENIAGTLSELGLSVYYVDRTGHDDFFVGDAFVYTNGRYIPSSYFGGLGESGYVVFGKDFALIGEEAFTDRTSAIRQEKGALSDLDFAQDLYGTRQVYVLPTFLTGTFLRDVTFRHIDLFVGSVPEANLLTVDKDYAKTNWNKKKTFEDALAEIKDRFGTISLMTDESGFGNNYRIFNTPQGNQAVIVGESTALQPALQQHGIPYITTNPLPNLRGKLSGIHCVTNVVHDKKTLEMINELAYVGSLKITAYGYTR
ncbi:MAG: hypothetical protein V1743_05590 [Nanoarchaeota archaeon]